MKTYLVLAALGLPLIACADMTPTQQRALSGTAIGAGGGAVIGAMAGNAGLGAGIGAGAGLLGGCSSIGLGRPRTQPSSRVWRPDGKDSNGERPSAG
jgi:hypothetical protein